MSEDDIDVGLDMEARVLVPLELPDGEVVTDWLVDFLKDTRVFVLGCYQIPEQTSPEHAREMFEDSTRETVESVVEKFRQAGTEVSSDFVFTPDVVDSVERVAGELGSDAIVWARPVEAVDSVLAVVSDAINFERLVRCISVFGRDGLERLNLVVAETTDDERDEKSLMLEGLESHLEGAGIDPSIMETEFFVTDDRTEMVLDYSEPFDIVVVGEREPSAADWVFKPLAEELADEADVPVIIIRLEDGE